MAGVVRFKDNSGKVKREFRDRVQLALRLIGEECEGYAKEDCPVDTGRLRNSITYVTATKQGTPNVNKYRGSVANGQVDAKPSDYKPKGTPEDDSVYIGTNVEYATYVEFKSMAHKVGKAHFLRDAATGHNDRYKKIAEAVLKAD